MLYPNGLLKSAQWSTQIHKENPVNQVVYPNPCKSLESTQITCKWISGNLGYTSIKLRLTWVTIYPNPCKEIQRGPQLLPAAVPCEPTNLPGFCLHFKPDPRNHKANGLIGRPGPELPSSRPTAPGRSQIWDPTWTWRVRHPLGCP